MSYKHQTYLTGTSNRSSYYHDRRLIDFNNVTIHVAGQTVIDQKPQTQKTEKQITYKGYKTPSECRRAYVSSRASFGGVFGALVGAGGGLIAAGPMGAYVGATTLMIALGDKSAKIGNEIADQQCVADK
jgi:hypothetical protein